MHYFLAQTHFEIGAPRARCTITVIVSDDMKSCTQRRGRVLQSSRGYKGSGGKSCTHRRGRALQSSRGCQGSGGNCRSLCRRLLLASTPGSTWLSGVLAPQSPHSHRPARSSGRSPGQGATTQGSVVWIFIMRTFSNFSRNMSKCEKEIKLMTQHAHTVCPQSSCTI